MGGRSWPGLRVKDIHMSEFPYSRVVYGPDMCKALTGGISDEGICARIWISPSGVKRSRIYARFQAAGGHDFLRGTC
jgi:hypothetical protein